MARQILALSLLACAIPFLAGWFEQTTHFNFGPSDAGYLEGFEPSWEIDEQGVATHWSSYEASLGLPMTFRGSAAEMTYRFQRIYGETAQVSVRVNGVEVDRFEARGGESRERSARVLESVLARSPLHIDLVVDSHEGRNRGLRWDWLRLETDDGFALPTASTVAASWWVMVLLWITLHGLGADPTTKMLGGTGLALLTAGYGFGAGLLALTHWLDAIGPVVMVGCVVALVAARASGITGGVPSKIGVLVLLGFVIRSMGVFHPLFYHPDLRAHADMARILGEAGLHFWIEPSRYIAEQGVWTAAAVGRNYAFPFSPVFHIPFAIADAWLPEGGLERTMHWMKLAGAVLSALEIVLIYRLAQRWTSPTVALWCAAVVVIAPVSLSRLSYVFFAALFAHLLDLLCLDRLPRPDDSRGESLRSWATFLFLLCITLASYAGSLIHFGLLVPFLGGMGWLLTRRRAGRTYAVRILAGALLTASVVMLTVYHEFFWVFVSEILPRAIRGEDRGGTLSLIALARLAVGRLGAFYHPVEALLIFVGALTFFRSPGITRWSKSVAIAWLGSFLVELAMRSAMPQLFGKVKEILWVSPLLAIFAGLALERARGRLGRVAAIGLFAILAMLNLRFFALEIAARFLLAR